jgi:predicted HTH transcriptional regulator
MLDHGLDAPAYAEQDGYFIVTFEGPNGDYDRLKVPERTTGLISPAIEARLNERQKQIILHVQKEGSVTRGWCVAKFKVANDTAGRDLKELIELGILLARGKGRAAHYVIRVPGEIDRESADVT